MLKIGSILLILSLLKCNLPKQDTASDGLNSRTIKGGLLTTDFKSFEEFRNTVAIEYSNERNSSVKLSHTSNEGTVISILHSGVSESDFIKAKEGGFLKKVRLALLSPYFVVNRRDLLRIYILSRRRHKEFGWKDIAFFDLAESMRNNIFEEDRSRSTKDELSEKGYLNSFNHITAQALMTSLFNRKLADFIADTHERKNMPELITGKFTKEQLTDIKSGAVDNYVDIINNEWGQELGLYLKNKYNIDRHTLWTPELLSQYLNDVQSYLSKVFDLRFNPYESEDPMIVHFSVKLNRVMDDVSGMW